VPGGGRARRRSDRAGAGAPRTLLACRASTALATCTNLVAQDLERLVAFYEEILGCERVPRRVISPATGARATGLPRAHLRGHHLRLPGCGDGGRTLDFTYDEVLAQATPVGGHHGPPVVEHEHLGAAEVDGEDHPRAEAHPGATPADVGDMRRRVHGATDAVAAELAHHGAAGEAGDLLDGSADVAEAGALADDGDAGVEAGARGGEEVAGLGAGLADREGCSRR
jgi:hypothetical protein